MKERLQGRLEGWQSHLLSQAGKATLIRLVAQAIPCYTLSTFKALVKFCEELNSLVRRFWWNMRPGKSHYFAPKAWVNMCTPKVIGGLSFQLFKELNKALLVKLAWKVASEDPSLWCHLLRAKYLHFGSFFSCHSRVKDSYIWKRILSTKHVLQMEACFKIGDGTSIFLWIDPWVPNIFEMVPILKENLNWCRWGSVTTFYNEMKTGWNKDLILSICEE